MLQIVLNVFGVHCNIIRSFVNTLRCKQWYLGLSQFQAELHRSPFIARSVLRFHGHVLHLLTTGPSLCSRGQRRALTSKVNHCTTSSCGVHYASQSASYVGHMHSVQYKTPPYLSPFPILSPPCLQQWTNACTGALYGAASSDVSAISPPSPPQAILNSCNCGSL
jgi:hypothetical protein